MRTKNLNRLRLMPLLVIAAALALSACDTTGPTGTPTTDVNAIYTSAFYTLSAQQATQIAATPPTAAASQTPLPATSVPGAAVTAALPVTGGSAAPGSAGTTAQVCDNSAYVSDVTIPDGTVVQKGQAFTKTWAVMNTGTCPWTTAYRLSFLGGTAMNGSTVALPAAIAPGEQAQISVNLVGPSIPGSYTGTWRLENAVGIRFGDVITVVVTVPAAAGATTSAAPVATSTP